MLNALTPCDAHYGPFMQVVGVTFGVLGTIVGFVSARGVTQYSGLPVTSIHDYLSTTVVALSVAQLSALLVRPPSSSRFRIVWCARTHRCRL